MHENVIKEFRKLKGKGTIILFGSLSKGTARFDSDIDVAVVSDDKMFIKKVEAKADEILFEYGRVVSVLKFTSREFKNSKEPIIKDIKKGRVLYEG